MRQRPRALALFVSSLAALALTACRPATPEPEGEPTAGDVFSDAVPADYDWRLTLHGGSGDLTFGDGDWAEGAWLLQLSCLPRSRRVEVTWPGEDEAVLTAGTATGTFAHAQRVETDHPVLAALKDTGAISLGRGGLNQRLTAEGDGRRALSDFFVWCDEGREPRPPEPEPKPVEEAPTTEEAQADAPAADPAAPTPPAAVSKDASPPPTEAVDPTPTSPPPET